MAVRILEESLVNKIAAGEVVERPASVVKELVENSLDAGATELRVHLRAGGRNLVRVVDNGSGMDRTDALMCLERHATSKIRSDDDLFRVATLGFRGEAIPSIASVSKFEVITRVASAEMGHRVAVDGGKLIDVSPAGSAQGTEISVASLFYNVPARRKFLRSVETELGHCIEAITRELLIRPHVDLEVTHDERSLLRCPRTESHGQRAADLLGAHGEALVPVAFSRGRLKVEALVSPVGVHRQSAAGSSYLYVNGRFVRDLVLRRAITAAYAGIVPKDRYPVVIVRVEIPVEDVDVNVHPAKTEVRFLHAFELQGAVAEGLRTALQDFGIHRPVATEARYRPREEKDAEQISLLRSEAPPLVWGANEPTAAGSAFAKAPGGDSSANSQPAGEDSGEERPRPVTISAADVAGFRASEENAGLPQSTQRTQRPDAESKERPDVVALLASASPQAVGALAEATMKTGGQTRGVPPPFRTALAANNAPARRLLPVARFRDLTLLGQLDRSYLLCEGGKELVIIDQHAAHERINLVRLQKDPRGALGGSQRLLTPILVDLGPARARIVAAAAEQLGESGLDLSHLGGGTIGIHGVPAPLASRDLPAILADMADDLTNGGDGHVPKGILDHVLATLACHTAVRANQTLDHREMTAILHDLDEVDHAVCAHGRPVAVRISVAELAHRFHRT